MKIYTKVGDGGDTFLFGGKKVRKNDPRVAAYGGADELNSLIGWVLSQLGSSPFSEALKTVQNELFIVGAELATPSAKLRAQAAGQRPDNSAAPAKAQKNQKIPVITQEHVARLESAIDRLEAVLPPLKTFILPGGVSAAAGLHMARAVCRRAERDIVAIPKKEKINPQIQVYFNRLSDYLFVLARAVNKSHGGLETPWAPPQD